MQTTKRNDNSMECFKSTVILNANNNRFSFVPFSPLLHWMHRIFYHTNTMRWIWIPFSIHLINWRDGKENKTRRKAIETDLFMVFIVFGREKQITWEKSTNAATYGRSACKRNQTKPNQSETTVTWKDQAMNKWNWKKKHEMNEKKINKQTNKAEHLIKWM